MIDKNQELPVKIPEDIGKAVREARRKAGMTQAQAAALCGVGVRFLSDLENGKATLQLGKTLHVLRNLGLFLSVKPRTLV
jgi:y4mF family transcriptional regulator